MNAAISVIALLLLLAGPAVAKEYGQYDPQKLLTLTKTVDGERYGFDLQYLDLIVGDLAVHARDYPPQFDHDGDKKRAIVDVQIISGMLEVLTSAPDVSPDILRRSSLLHSIGHNLDIPGAAEKADRDYQKLLQQLPDDAAANYGYGLFLVGAGRGSQALSYLSKAAQAGAVDAYYALGLVYLTQHNNEAALKYLTQYQQLKPNDSQVGQIIAAIKSDSIEFKSK